VEGTWFSITRMSIAEKVFDPRPSSMSRSNFVTRFGGVYEHSPWVAERAFDAGLNGADDTPEGLAARLRRIVEAAGEQAWLALLRAHPELAGKLAVTGGLTKDSAAEQASAGLDRCTETEYRRFHELNAIYLERFGFPFIIAVRGLSRTDILAAFEARAGNARGDEIRTALDQVHRIARLRLEAMV
jgi:urate oxidase